MSASPALGTTKTAQPNQIPQDAGLTEYEAALVRDLVGREPNALEWAMFGAMWSEHCAYKHSKRLLRSLPSRGASVAVGPGENAGAVDLGGGLLCVFKVESHNHPSAIEPFQGAATGVGGILRDVFAMGARPTAVLNALFFGDPTDPGVRRTIAGVTGGISFYGNCVGIPDVAGHISFESCYAENPLVNAMCVGFARSEDLRKASGARPGSAVYLVGSDTGRDGIAGASLLASFELGTGSDAKRPSVQVGNPFLEKLLLEATLELVAADAIEAVQDLGAAGLTCAVSEVAAKSGVGIRIDVALVPRRARDMTPHDVMLSESQERMLVVARPGRERDVEQIFKRWELHGSRIGEVIGEPVLQIFDADQLVAELPPRSLADDAPEYDVSSLAAAYAASAEGSVVLGGPSLDHVGSRVPLRAPAPSPEPHPTTAKIGLELLDLLASPAVASRRAIYRTYDQMVGTDTVVGPGADAAVMRIKGRTDGIAIAIDAQPRLAALDPYVGAAAAVAEATRNLVCMGATPMAITDCLNIGNPERSKGAWQLTRTVEGITAACDALGVPVVSGNVSLYNATHGADIWPTAVIGAVGRLADVTKHIAPTSGKPGDLVLLAGSAVVSLGASAYGATHGIHEGPVDIDLALEARLQRFVLAAHAQGAIRAAHDRDAGGLAAALAEIAIRDGIGMKVTLPAIRGIDKRIALFGEGPSGIVLVIDPSRDDEVRRLAREHDVPLWTLGTVGGDLLEVAPVLGTPVSALADAHARGLGRALGRDA
ncbi:MAG TPA: phosphoribosylformylglycinamidine synthase subunit PurL [Candidatus Polarisedimenticolia bacterium]|nr:phosphoribosylformylglycinamidine synthase subunit PurL [Candidatus Polarisedimenticolia bacterium]